MTRAIKGHAAQKQLLQTGCVGSVDLVAMATVEVGTRAELCKNPRLAKELLQQPPLKPLDREPLNA